MNTEVIDRLIEQDPALESSRESLSAMQAGAYCIHRSWGFGKIAGFDDERGMILIDFEDGDRKSHAMDPVFCIDKLEVLAEDHVLAEHRNNPAEIEALAKKEPAELIIKILSRGDDGCVHSREIERILSYLFGAAKAKRWWTATKKVLVKDPRVAVPNKKNEPYILRDEPVKPEQEILHDFFEEKRSYEKIVLAEKLFDLAAEKEDLQADLPQVLHDLTIAIMEAKNLSQADRLYGIWVRNNLARDVEEDVEKLEPTSASILEECLDDLPGLANLMPAKFHSRFLDLVSRVYPDDWKKKVVHLLQSTNTKFSGECAHFLVDRDEKKLLVSSITKSLDEQSLRAAVLLWILKFRKLAKFKDILEVLISPRLLTATFSAIDYEALQNATSKRIPLAEVLSDDRELLRDILAKGTLENAKDLAQALLLNPGFEDLTKKSLLARFIKLHPEIQSLLDRDAESSSSSLSQPAVDDTLIVSQESYDKKLADLDIITKEKIPANSLAIEAARELGDLKENAEYQMAKDDQKVLLARQAELQSDLMRAKPTDFTEVSDDRVGIGSIVKVVEAGSETREFTILGAWDSDPDNHILSYLTPLGQSLLGKGVGDEVVIDVEGNSQSLKIEEISRWVDKS
jgi:transcription elongation GreA/GreB family factor